MSKDVSDTQGIPETPAVRSALNDPQTLLEAATTGEPGWADPYGGPEGVARLTDVIRDRLDAQAREMSALRAVAVAELLRDRSMAETGRMLGIGKAAVHKINNSAPKSPYAHLLVEGKW